MNSNDYITLISLSLIFIAFVLLIFILAFIGVSSIKGLKELNYKEIAILCAIFICYVLETTLLIDTKKSYLIKENISNEAQITLCFLLYLCSLILMVNYKKFWQRKKRQLNIFNDNLLMFGIMQVALAMIISSRGDKNFFYLALIANMVYLVLPAYAIYILTIKPEWWKS